MKKILSCISIVLITANITIAQYWMNLPTQSPVNSIAIDSLNNLWIGNGYESSVTKFDGSIWIPSLDAGYVRTIEIDTKGNVWVGTDYHGIYKYDGTNWTQYTSDDGLVFNVVTAIAFDSLGNNWIGTADVMGVINIKGGVSKFDGTTWKNYTTEDGLASNLVWSIAIDHHGKKWFGTSEGISKFDGINWTTYNSYIPSTGSVPINFSHGFWSIFIDKNDIKWFGTLGEGVFKYDGIKWITFGQLDGLSVLDIVMDRQGNMWFGTDNGAFKFDGTTWIHYTTADGLIDNMVYSIATDHQNNIWFATYKGLSKLTDTPVGISSHTISHFSIFPNPASNSITIDFPSSSSQKMAISIKNQNGIEVQKEVLHLTTTRTIDVSRLMNGIYYLTIKSEDEISTQKLVIKR